MYSIQKMSNRTAKFAALIGGGVFLGFAIPIGAVNFQLWKAG